METINKLFVTFNIAFEMRQKGFNEPCLAKYSGGSKEIIVGGVTQSQMATWLLAPTWDQAINWLEDNFNIIALTSKDWAFAPVKYSYYLIVGNETISGRQFTFRTKYESKEKSLIEALKYIP